ncbi:MAG: class II aldolase/adducin family protein [Actinobacteria bacterium]|nr:class II aldolase/adducin family protein [Actinomycetota bacterium]MBU4240967.1 class II aldolase/adducin family protein [Actinomycetota bacterium]MBU4301827.1 class II aldolase/adducin family protein [Actinomycetota bacterium]MBU4386103.1 class II aldolase/adducin family protein [Actinomycetota bacterium]MCG2794542.1 class II aldolase/adducin family protein [Actinomycetes bacterium]
MAGMKPGEIKGLTAACRRMYEGGLVTGALGAVGVRTSAGDVMVSRAGSRLGFLEDSDILLMNGTRPQSGGKGKGPTRDAGIFKAVLAVRREAGSVIRINSPYATALAHRGRKVLEKSQGLLEDLGGVVFVPFYRPGTAGLAGAVAEVLRENRIAIIEGQGSVVWGTDIEDAVDQAEALEAAAKVIFLLNGNNGA